MSGAAPALPRAFFTAPLAHRGLHDRAKGVIENSRAAMSAALEKGYGIELDLQLSADGEVMVFHDDDLTRLTGASGLVRSKTAAELGEIRLKDSDECIPTLAEILTLVAGRAPLLIEAKDQSLTLAPVEGVLEARTAALLKEYDGPVALMSFNPHSVAAFQKAAPNLPRGRTTCSFCEKDWGQATGERRVALARLDDLDSLGCSFISHQYDELDTDPVAAVKATGCPVFCWTIRSKTDEAKARTIADNITFEGYAA